MIDKKRNHKGLNLSGRIVDAFLSRMQAHAERAYDNMRSVKKADRHEHWDNNIKYWHNVLSGIRWMRGQLKQQAEYQRKRRAPSHKDSA